MFKLRENHTTVGKEMLADVTTFSTMAYIVFVNPAILAKTGMDAQGVMVATCLAGAFGSILTGLLANYPFAQAPGMGLNAFFAFTVVAQYGYSWQQALGIVFISGVLFVALTLTGARARLAYAIPASIRQAIPAGIGLFIVLIGLNNAGIIKVNQGPILEIIAQAGHGDAHGLAQSINNAPPQVWELGNLASPSTALACLGIALCAILHTRRIGGAMIITVAIITAAAIGLGMAPLPSTWAIGLGGVENTFMQLTFDGLVGLGGLRGAVELMSLILIFSMVDLFDTMGTLLGTAQKGGFMDQSGKLPRIKPAMMSDALATCMGALLGTSTTTTYIESASGIQAGGRTGLVAVVVGGLFILAIFLSPLVGVIPVAATTPILVIVGLGMAGTIKHIDFNLPEVYLPALATVVAMPFTFSIANGIGFGIILHVLLTVAKHGPKSVGITLWVLFALFALRYMVV